VKRVRLLVPALALAAALAAAPVLAVQPDEVLADPALEARARELSRGLRCPVCQSESIDESNATVARDLRLFLRERLLAGDSDDAVIDAMVSRYGEYILLAPDRRGGNLVLWLAPPAVFLVALVGVLVYVRRRRTAPEPPSQPLDAEEQAELDRILARPPH